MMPEPIEEKFPVIIGVVGGIKRILINTLPDTICT